MATEGWTYPAIPNTIQSKLSHAHPHTQLPTVEGCLYAVIPRPSNSSDQEELTNMRSTLASEVQNVTKQQYGTFANPQSAYVNTGGHTLLQSLRILEDRLNNQQAELSRQAAELSRQAAEIEVLGAFRASTRAARKRFYTHSKLKLSGAQPSWDDKDAIMAGNIAVHRGDLRTDTALFKLAELGPEDGEEFQRLYGMTTEEALTVTSESIVQMANKRASILAEGEAWTTEDDRLYHEVLQFGKTASEAELMQFENDEQGNTSAARSWYRVMSIGTAN